MTMLGDILSIILTHTVFVFGTLLWPMSKKNAFTSLTVPAEVRPGMQSVSLTCVDFKVRTLFDVLTFQFHSRALGFIGTASIHPPRRIGHIGEYCSKL
jgi:hypothetical protein